MPHRGLQPGPVRRAGGDGALASLVDLLPTISTLAGADGGGAGLRGRDLSPVLARHADPGREALAAAPVDLERDRRHPSPADSVQEAVHFTFDDHQAGTATREAPGQPNRVRAVRTASHKYAIYVDPAAGRRPSTSCTTSSATPTRRATSWVSPSGEARSSGDRARSTSCASGCEARLRAAGPRCGPAESGPARAPRSYTRPVPLPPGPRAPASVNTARLAVRPLETLLGWHRRYGDAFTVRYLVFGTGVYVADPEAIREMFTGDQSDLHAGEANAPLSPVLGEHSVLVLDGAEHLRQRRLLLPPFQGSAVADWRAVIAEVAEAEVDRWTPRQRARDARADARADLRRDLPRRLRGRRARAGGAPARGPARGRRQQLADHVPGGTANGPRALVAVGPVHAPAGGCGRPDL